MFTGFLQKKYPLTCILAGQVVKFRCRIKKLLQGREAKKGLFSMKNYTEAKGRNQVVARFSHAYVSVKMQKRICECGNWLDFIADWQEERRKLMAANFCKWRFCPMCAMRKSRIDALRISVLMTYISKVHGKSFIMVTLTAPNVKADKLSEEITRYNECFKKLTRRKEVAGINHGYIRKLEVTYNKKRDDYHPHFHVVFAVNRSYFNSRDYVKQEKWLSLWRECMDDLSITQVDVRKVRQSVDSNDMAGDFVAAEIAKYAAKDKDFTHSTEVFDAFYHALKGRQKLTYNGLFAVSNKKYKNDELDEYIKQDATVYYWQLVYMWRDKEYAESKRRPLDAGDKLFLARRGIDTELVD
jgi:plasmid rolling circle replication initiator protein Rep